MSTFETKTSDNFIFDESHDPREHLSDSTPFMRKNIAYVVDQQAGNGSYSSGEVIIDSQSIAASGNVIDWRNAYLAVPYVVKVNVANGTGVTWTGGAGVARYCAALKNCSLVDSLKVEANGRTIIANTTGLAQLINFKLASTMTPSALAKDGAVIGYWPDDQGAICDGGADSTNAANDPLSSSLLSDGITQYNRGMVERQNNWLPSVNTSFMSAANAQEEGAAWDYGTALVPSTASAADVSDVHFIATIRLRDLHDYFDKHSLSRGVSYRLTIKFNQAVSTVVSTSTTTPFSATPTVTPTAQTSGTCQPAMLCWGASSMFGRLTASAATIVTATVTSAIDTSANTRFSGIRLYVPSYELEPKHQEQLISRNPVIKKTFLDFQTVTTLPFATGASINVQVSTSATNPKALVIIPRWAASGTNSQGFYSDVSPLSTVPGSTDALLSLTNMQIKMGNSYVLADRVNYTFQQFQDHVSGLFALNGGQTNQTSGLISKKAWEVNQRYYCYDLSRYPEAMNNLPQMISVECKNNTAVPVELMCILLYGRDAEFNLASGSLTITA